MKKLVLLLCFCFVLLLCSSTTALAQSTSLDVDGYLRVTNNTTPIYRDKYASDFLFCLPYSYYVKVLEEFSDLVHVECFGGQNTPSIDGYVPKSLLFDENTPTRLPYLDLAVTTYTATTLYQDAECTTPIRHIFADRTLGYYGSVSENGQVYFVYYMGYTGYVKEDTLMPFSVPDHPDAIKPQIQPETEQQTGQNVNDFKGLKTAIVICLLMAGVIGFFSVLKTKSKNGVASPIYEEDY